MNADAKWITPDNYNEFIPAPEVGSLKLLTGIHQCGDLSSSSIKEFVRNKESLTHLAVVGCCYNCLTERIDRARLLESSENFRLYRASAGVDKAGRCLDDTLLDIGDKSSHGFPLSLHVQ